MSRSLWDRLGGRVASRSRELDRDDCSCYIATTRRTEDAKGPQDRWWRWWRQVTAGAEATSCLSQSNLVRPGYAAIQWWSSTAPSSPSRRQIKTTPRSPVYCSTSWRSTWTQCSMRRRPLADRRQDEQAALPGGTQQAVDAFLAEITTPPLSSSRSSQHWGLNSATPAATRYW